MHGSLADLPEEYFAAAVVSANELYARMDPSGRLPDHKFYKDFLKLFLLRDALHARLDQIHSGLRDTAEEERELLRQIMEVNALIVKRNIDYLLWHETKQPD